MTDYHVDYFPESVRTLRQIAKYLAERSDIAPFTVTSMINK